MPGATGSYRERLVGPKAKMPARALRPSQRDSAHRVNLALPKAKMPARALRLLLIHAADGKVEIQPKSKNARQGIKTHHLHRAVRFAQQDAPKAKMPARALRLPDRHVQVASQVLAPQKQKCPPGH